MDPSSELYCDLSLALRMSNRVAEALAAARHAIRLDPGLTPWVIIAKAMSLPRAASLEGNRSFEAALQCRSQVLPRDEGAGNRGGPVVRLGERGQLWYARWNSIRATPRFTPLSCLFSPSAIWRRPNECWKNCGDGSRCTLRHYSVFTHTPDPVAATRRIKIGFVSGDFWDHPVRFFVTPILRALARTRFEVVCYSNTFQPDAVTAGMRTLADHWHEVFGAGDDELAQRIKNDGIDILVDLSGNG